MLLDRFYNLRTVPAYEKNEHEVPFLSHRHKRFSYTAAFITHVSSGVVFLCYALVVWILCLRLHS
jgi:hypothetical protein